MYRTIYSTIRCTAGSQNKAKITVRIALALIFLLSGFAHPASANVIYVTTLEDGIGTGACSLKEAIYSSNFQNNVAIQSYSPSSQTAFIVTTQCVPGDGNDIIVLPAGQVLQITYPVEDPTNPTGPTATQLITGTVTIEGYGATLQWVPVCTNSSSIPCNDSPSGGPAYTYRLFAVGPSGSLTLHNVYIKGFLAQGGSGVYGGGGGGMGAGGAVYVQGGTLVVENSTFAGNGAVGGNGGGLGPGDTGGGGGGGGVGGAGGYPGTDQNGLGVYADGGGGGGGSGYGTSGGAGLGEFYGGAGGGTVFDGDLSGGYGGFTCGASGGATPPAGYFGQSGANASCPGGGGGGGGWGVLSSGNGGNGSYGGGGGGGAQGGGNGGNGGFGGGGGAGWAGAFGNTDGGNGGFGGGGGAGPNGYLVGNGAPGQGGGPWGGNADARDGGGGAGLGGAIFNDSGEVLVTNSTFVSNYVTRGVSGGGAALNGGDGGGAIFSNNGHLTVNDVTIANNLSTGSGGGIVVYQTDPNASTLLNLENTIIWNNGSMVNGELTNAANECWIAGGSSVAVEGAGNLIQNNNNCEGVVTTGDPELGALQNNGGFTPTMAIPETSAAFLTADPDTSLSTDQRNDPRPEMGGYDIGAFELCISSNPNFVGSCSAPLGTAPPPEQLTIQVSPSGTGTTTPAPGTYDEPQGTVVSLTAIPALGYAFGSWSGNVGNQQGAATPIVMLQPQAVTANFVLCNCVVDISSYVTVTPGPIVLNPITRRYAETVMVTNTSGSAITSAISLVLDNLANATLVNATGTTAFGSPSVSPYITMSGGLAAGQTVSFSLLFSDPTNGAISYTTRVLAP